MCSPLHYRLPDTTQQHQTHHRYSYPPYSHLYSHWVRPLQPSTAPTHCPTASYPLQHLYNTLQSTALQHFYSLQPLQHPSELAADQAASLSRLANGLRHAFVAALCCARVLELQHIGLQVRVLAELKGGLTAVNRVAGWRHRAVRHEIPLRCHVYLRICATKSHFGATWRQNDKTPHMSLYFMTSRAAPDLRIARVCSRAKQGPGAGGAGSI